MSLLEPASIAVVGASATEGKVGHAILKNLLTQGYKGKVYPINPKHEEILGVQAFASVTDIPEDVECAVIATPAKTVPAIVKECGEKKVKTVVIISAGFSETGTDEGEQIEEEIRKACAEYGINLVGTNCLGIIRPAAGLNASFAKDIPEDGSVALISQSGAMGVALMDLSPAFHLGYSFVFSIGNKTAMNECGFLEIAEKDERTKVVGLYLESIDDGQRFLEVARRVSATKPVVLLKAGVSEKGKHAVSSHTGALAGSDAAIDAACAQANIHRAQDAEEFLDLLRTLSTQPQLLSRQIAVITNAGGPGILATDAAERFDLMLTELTDDTVKKLEGALPEAASTANPIDVLGDADTARFAAALEACGEDPNVDGIAVMLTPQVMTPVKEVVEEIAKIEKKYSLMPVVTSFMGGASVHEARDALRTHGIPSFETPERAMRALAALRASKARSSEPWLAAPVKECDVIGDHTGLLPQSVVGELFAQYDLPLPHQKLTRTADDAVASAEQIGYPVIAKISSADILHKTDIGGIRADLNTAEEVREAFDEVMANAKEHQPEADVAGVLIQQFLPVGNEFIIGSLRDPSFGPLIMVGLGGIYTELFRDTSFRIAPVTEEEAYTMLQELKSWDVLLGMRGKEQSDIAALAKMVAAVSRLVTDCPQIEELDLNPVMVSPEGIVIADAKVVVA